MAFFGIDLSSGWAPYSIRSKLTTVGEALECIIDHSQGSPIADHLTLGADAEQGCLSPHRLTLHSLSLT